MLIHNTTHHIYEDRNCRYAQISQRRIRFTILIVFPEMARCNSIRLQFCRYETGRAEGVAGVQEG